MHHEVQLRDARGILRTSNWTVSHLLWEQTFKNECVWRWMSVNVCVINMWERWGCVVWWWWWEGLVQCVGSLHAGRRKGGSTELDGGRESLKNRSKKRTDYERRRLTHIQNLTRKMPNFEGTWKMKSSENFEELLRALGEDDLLFFLLCVCVFWGGGVGL